MTADKRSTQNHREIAINFLLKANEETGDPIPQADLEAVYDLFAEGEAKTINYQMSLKKIVIKK